MGELLPIADFTQHGLVDKENAGLINGPHGWQGGDVKVGKVTNGYFAALVSISAYNGSCCLDYITINGRNINKHRIVEAATSASYYVDYNNILYIKDVYDKQIRVMLLTSLT